MTTRLTDVVVPQVFSPYTLVETKRQSKIFQSGILRDDKAIAEKLKGGSTTFNIPFWKDLGRVASNIPNDNPASIAVPQKITADKMAAVRQIRTQSWAAADLTSELAGDDPMKSIAARVGKYWADEYQAILVSTLRGIINANFAQNGSDMVRDISTDAAGAPSAAELVSAESILQAKQTMGDAGNDLDTLLMHSTVFTRLQVQNLVTTRPNSENNANFDHYLGLYRIVVDDGMPAIAGANRIRFYTILTKKESVGWAEVPVEVPDETKREPGQGNGMGIEQLFSRRQFVMHPYGYRWTGASQAGDFPTNPELETAANWTRVVPERKQVPFAVLITNG